MKIVIETTENHYKACKDWHKNKMATVEQSLIAYGVPYEERPQGEWIRKVDEAGFISHICSECGAEIEVEDCSDDKFCFNCGAEMRGEENV